MLLWRLTSIILKIEAPRPAADVRKPERSEWPAKSIGIETDAPGAGLDHPDHGAIGEVQSSAPDDRRRSSPASARPACSPPKSFW